MDLLIIIIAVMFLYSVVLGWIRDLRYERAAQLERERYRKEVDEKIACMKILAELPSSK
jgi:hypothetical protein